MLLPAGCYPVSHPMDSTVAASDKHPDRLFRTGSAIAWLTPFRTACKFYQTGTLGERGRKPPDSSPGQESGGLRPPFAPEVIPDCVRLGEKRKQRQ